MRVGALNLGFVPVYLEANNLDLITIYEILTQCVKRFLSTEHRPISAILLRCMYEMCYLGNLDLYGYHSV